MNQAGVLEMGILVPWTLGACTRFPNEMNPLALNMSHMQPHFLLLYKD